MSTDLTTRADPGALSDQIEFARMVTSGTGSSILPDAYRGSPANILIAVGLGAAMGLSPAESLYRISVIKGKPSAGAELIAANVRKAGHALRVVGDETTCTATIIRADDREFAFEVTRDMEWAKRMGLATSDNYRKQPGTMLQWRAITACARLACPEALYGVSHTPDELRESAPALSPSRPGASMLQPAQVDITPDDPEPANFRPAGVTEAQMRKIGASMKSLGLAERGLALQYASGVVGREVPSRAALTREEASVLIDQMDRDLTAARPAPTAAPIDVTTAEVLDDSWPPAEEPQR